MFENYDPLKPHVEHVGPGWIRAFVLDEPIEIGEALAIIGPDNQTVFAEVRRHTGNRRVEALLVHAPAWLQTGLPVQRTARPVAVHFPASGDFHLTEHTLQPFQAGQNTALRHTRPAFAELDGARPPLSLNIEAIDLLAPLSERGLNLIIDSSPTSDAFQALAGHAAAASNFHAILSVSAREPDVPQRHRILADDPLQALRLAAAWAVHLRDSGQNVLLIAELPPVTGQSAEETSRQTDNSSAPTLSLGDIIDLLGQTLASTHTASITTVLRLHLVDTAGLEDIIETMHLGETDSQIFITPDARFEPYRSLSRAQLSASQSSARDAALTILSRAQAAQDRAELFGEDELQENEKGALQQAEAWAVHLS